MEAGGAGVEGGGGVRVGGGGKKGVSCWVDLLSNLLHVLLSLILGDHPFLKCKEGSWGGSRHNTKVVWVFV